MGGTGEVGPEMADGGEPRPVVIDDGPTMSSPISLVPTLSDADSEVELTAWDCRVRVRCGEIPCVAETELGVYRPAELHFAETCTPAAGNQRRSRASVLGIAAKGRQSRGLDGAGPNEIPQGRATRMCVRIGYSSRPFLT